MHVKLRVLSTFPEILLMLWPDN